MATLKLFGFRCEVGEDDCWGPRSCTALDLLDAKRVFRFYGWTQCVYGWVCPSCDTVDTGQSAPDATEIQPKRLVKVWRVERPNSAVVVPDFDINNLPF